MIRMKTWNSVPVGREVWQRRLLFVFLATISSVLFGEASVAQDSNQEDVVDKASIEHLEALQHALNSLIDLQAPDGAWHSEHYGPLKQGAALTTFVLYSISHVPGEIREPYDVNIERAFEFLRTGVEANGFVTNPENSHDNPIYCTAMLLVAAERLSLPLEDETRQKMIKYLVDSQLADKRGFESDHVEYGGWDNLGPDPMAGKTSGTSISITCFILESLAEVEGEEVGACKAIAEGWLTRISEKSLDGGFFFTPRVESPNNKAQWLDDKSVAPRSYGTATCDGVRALSYLNIASDDERFAPAVRWLSENTELDEVPGFENNLDESSWQDGLRYYYYSTLSKTLQHLPEASRAQRRQQLIRHVIDLQGDDGLWKNTSSRMREDDPLIASPFSIIVLGELIDDQ